VKIALNNRSGDMQVAAHCNATLRPGLAPLFPGHLPPDCR